MKLVHYGLDYESDRKKHEVFLTEGDGSDFIIQVKPLVVYKNFITIGQRGKVVGHLDATFDFSTLPPAFHELGLALLHQKSRNLSVPRWWLTS